MRWSNVLIIFRREVRDQIRDRRTLFMIFVLPILLYPVLGIGVLQFSEAFEQKPRKVVLVGAELPAREAPAAQRRAATGSSRSLFDSRDEAARLLVEVEPAEGLARPGPATQGDPPEGGRRGRHHPRGPPPQARPLPGRENPDRVREHRRAEPDHLPAASRRCSRAGRKLVVKAGWPSGKLPPSYTEPIQVKGEDVATAKKVRGGVSGRRFSRSCS